VARVSVLSACARVTDVSEVPARFDTVAIAVPIDDFDRIGTTHTVSNFATPAETHKWSRKLSAGGFLATGFGHKAWIEASIPKRMRDGENVLPVDEDELLDGLSDLYDDACRYVQVSRGHLFEESKVIRLDMVRDFQNVKDQTVLLDGLGRLDHPGRSKVRRFNDPSKGQAETLRVGPRAWACTLYDKAAESGTAPPGSLRFEARLHHDQLTSKFASSNGGHVQVVADLVDRSTALARAQRAWFGRAGFDASVAPRDVIGQLVRNSGLSPVRQGSLWAYLTLPGFGPSLHRNTRRRYRQLAQGLGVAPAWFHADDTVRPIAQVYRLDYDAGTSVAA